MTEDNDIATADPRVDRRGFRKCPVLAPDDVLDKYFDAAPGKADIED